MWIHIHFRPSLGGEFAVEDNDPPLRLWHVLGLCEELLQKSILLPDILCPTDVATLVLIGVPTVHYVEIIH